MSKAILKLDWCDYKAAKYAVEHWHYSKVLSVSTNVFIGVWENTKFIGVIVFGRGANKNIGNPYGLEQTEVCELTRVALNKHINPVTRILAIAIKLLKKQSIGIKLIVSYADPNQKHYGGIYQGGGWIYEGLTDSQREYFVKDRWVHGKQANCTLGSVKGLKFRQTLPKYKYLYPLTQEMRDKIEPLRKPYPKPAL